MKHPTAANPRSLRSTRRKVTQPLPTPRPFSESYILLSRIEHQIGLQAQVQHNYDEWAIAAYDANYCDVRPLMGRVPMYAEAP
ncbi:hypothetical protein LJY25_14620 [Hymenobacter sp. BT175]|uniref:hypothetical protein n=1 Tax=Hymenobacter translucens TaxID=2886507 RepID=UPI001D0F2BC7|nr:hypothetical protein [Hymenobacter translucens]MCC2547686.1 hypothetical protein [Hymenobacter translucens]